MGTTTARQWAASINIYADAVRLQTLNVFIVGHGYITHLDEKTSLISYTACFASVLCLMSLCLFPVGRLWLSDRVETVCARTKVRRWSQIMDIRSEPYYYFNRFDNDDRSVPLDFTIITTQQGQLSRRLQCGPDKTNSSSLFPSNQLERGLQRSDCIDPV